jgi:uncharacterized membrane protein
MSSPITTERIKPEALPSAQLFNLAGHTASASALLCFGLVLWQTIARTPLPGKPGWAEALLVVTTTIATIASLARQLPGPKVMIGAAIIAILGGSAHAIGASASIPFGPFVYTDAIGPRLFGNLAWPMPLLWIIIVLNARGVARLGLKPWRKTKTYGFWVMGVATFLVVLFNLGLEVYAAKVARYWLWLPTKFPFTWHNMPWINSLGWALVSLLMFAFATPFLINKSSRSRKLPPDYHPLIVWVLLLAWFGTGAALENFWSATVLCAVTALVSIVFAVRGARW